MAGHSMKVFSHRSAQISYLDQGSGEPVVFLHCSSASHRAWTRYFPLFVHDYRLVAPDLLGYGESTTWPRGDTPFAVHDLEMVEEFIHEIGEPVHLAGHSYGGALSVELARRDALAGRNAILSALLIEPVSFHLLSKGETNSAWSEIERVGRGVIAACQAGRYKRAANLYMRFWLGRWNWAMAPAKYRTEVFRTVHKVASEFQQMFDWRFSLQNYQSITIPVTLVVGHNTRRPARAVIEVLERTLPSVRRIEIENAGHMSLFTHRPDISKAMRDHFDWLDELRESNAAA